MSDIKAKMHQIRFRLGLRPRPRCRSLQRSPDPLSGGEGAGCPLPTKPTPALGPSGLAPSVRAWKIFTNISPCIPNRQQSPPSREPFGHSLFDEQSAVDLGVIRRLRPHKSGTGKCGIWAESASPLHYP